VKGRDFIALLGGAAAWPLAARAQQPAMPVIGILASVSPAPYASYIAAVKEGLRQTGYVEGRNVAIEYRWAEGQYDRLPQQAIELVDRSVAVIVLVGGGPTIAAAKAATATIPIAFVMGEDPVKSGAVASLNRPGGNATGVSLLTVAMEAKRLQLLHELIPSARAASGHAAAAPPSSVMNSRRLTRSPRRRGRAASAASRSMTRSNFVEARRMRVCYASRPSACMVSCTFGLAPIRAMYALMFGHFARSILWILVQLSTVNR